MIKTLLIIGAGSFAGGVARYLISKIAQEKIGEGFPWGTMIVNVLGCLLVGAFYGLFERGSIANDDIKIFLTVGFCGGFTTFSTFVHENYNLFNNENFFHFILYSVMSFGLGLAAAYLGHIIVKAL